MSGTDPTRATAADDVPATERNAPNGPAGVLQIERSLTGEEVADIKRRWRFKAIADAIERAILDRAPTWEETFSAGPGQVVSVRDAAVVAAQEVVRGL